MPWTHPDRSPTDADILAWLDTHEHPVTRDAVATEFNISPSMATQHLRRLAELGAAINRGRGNRWQTTGYGADTLAQWKNRPARAHLELLRAQLVTASTNYIEGPSIPRGAI